MFSLIFVRLFSVTKRSMVKKFPIMTMVFFLQFCSVFLCFSFLNLIYLSDTEEAGGVTGREREREKQAPPWSKDPDVGLDSRTLES